ncbi:hypothetical protein Ancab_005751 [Ancistrocladus abbreviatus]
MAERFAYYGIVGNLIMYLLEVLEYQVAAAAKIVNIWQGTTMICTLFGAFVADSYLGRFTTILISSFIYLLGLVLLVISTSLHLSIHHRAPLVLLALYIIAFGEGGHKPCVQTFAADQFDEDTSEEKKTKSSFFNWWCLGSVVGGTGGFAIVLFVQSYIGWAVGFAIPAAGMAVALALFLIGIRFYRRQGPLGSPFTRVAQVFVAAVRKRRLEGERFGICFENGDKGRLKLQNLARTNKFRFLDKAMILDGKDAPTTTRNPWRLCSLNQVEEVKLVLRLIPLWTTSFAFSVVQAQLSTFFTKQSSTMDRQIGQHFQLPPASLLICFGLVVAAFVVIYDRALVPLASKLTGHPSGITVLTRIGIGHLLSILAMIVAARIEGRRVRIAIENGLVDKPKAIVAMRIWWLLPQYLILGVADSFIIVGLQELFYDQMPEGLRSIGAAAYISAVGIGSFISSAIISVVQGISSRYGQKWLVDNLNHAHLDYFYWVIAGLCSLNLGIFVWIAKGFSYKKISDEDDDKKIKIESLDGA